MTDNKNSESDLQKHIGEEIKRARINAGLTQKELAEKIGYSHASSISGIENSREWVSLKTLDLICKVLNCELILLLRSK